METIDKLEKETKRLLYLINQLLEFRKAESGLMKLRAAKTNLLQFLEGIKDSFEDLAGKKNILFELSFHDEIPDIWIDFEKLEKIINVSINETLGRTILTSGTVFLVLLGLFFIGGAVIHDFSFVMLIGTVAGSYSTIYIAGPIVLYWEQVIPSKKKKR